MRRYFLGFVLAFTAIHCISTAARADEWWMLQNSEQGPTCGPPIEAEGVLLTPDELMKRFDVCKLAQETPSLDLKSVMVNCEGDINQVFVFARSKEICEGLR